MELMEMMTMNMAVAMAMGKFRFWVDEFAQWETCRRNSYRYL
jgi:hypothetical protein